MRRDQRQAHSTGIWAEEVAAAQLQQSGLTLLARNYRCRGGELDLVMRERELLVFVEVRFRGREDYGSPAESVDARKQRRLILSARHYLQTHPQSAQCDSRFDVVLVGGDRRQPTVEWIRNAFEA
ncbi:MAG: YraN family protein [Chromatiales bacterium]